MLSLQVLVRRIRHPSRPSLPPMYMTRSPYLRGPTAAYRAEFVYSCGYKILAYCIRRICHLRRLAHVSGEHSQASYRLCATLSFRDGLMSVPVGRHLRTSVYVILHIMWALR